MKKTAHRAVLSGLFICLVLPPAHAVSGSAGKVVRGWLADEGCARGRASSGLYTATNPDCAKKCVSQGQKIVLVVPDEKKILQIANQDAARQNIGDEVEITGTIDPGNKALHIDSLKMLSPGKAICGLPARPKKG